MAWRFISRLMDNNSVLGGEMTGESGSASRPSKSVHTHSICRSEAVLVAIFG